MEPEITAPVKLEWISSQLRNGESLSRPAEADISSCGVALTGHLNASLDPLFTVLKTIEPLLGSHFY